MTKLPRSSCLIHIISCMQEVEIKALLRDEMQTYSYQFKTASTVFNKEQVSFCTQ